MSTPITFGSFGDIFTLLQLAWQLRAALDAASGAGAEIQSVIADVDVFISALKDIQTFVERRSVPMRPDVTNGLNAALTRCRDTLRALLRQMKRAEARFSSSKWQRHWRSVAWSILGGKKDTEAFRQHLSEQVNIIQLYLGLSQAQDQNAIGRQLDRHGASLDRVYSVLQDIQLRFDVGIPSFRFFDEESASYYPPLTRTSLQRLNEILMAAGDQDIRRHIEQGSQIPWEDMLNRVESKRSLKFRFCMISFQCVFFKEAAFGQWQVLVYTGPQLHDSDRIIKHLLERRHAIGEACTCQGGFCSVLHEEYERHYDTARLYSNAAQLLMQSILEHEPDSGKNQTCATIASAFNRYPSPDFLRSVWMPSVRSGCSASSDATSSLELLLAAPSISIGADPLYVTSMRLKNMEFYSPIVRSALDILLTGKVSSDCLQDLTDASQEQTDDDKYASLYPAVCIR